MPVIQNFQAFMDGGGLVCPEGLRKIEWALADDPGLFVETRSSATSMPTWYVRLKGPKGNVYRRIGTTKAVTMPQARKLAKQIRAEHAVSIKAQGNGSVAAAPTELTWNTFISDHFAPYCKAHIRSAKKYDQLNRIYVAPVVGHQLLSTITRKQAQDLHVDIVEKQNMSPATADHVIKYMRAALNKAQQQGYLEVNPIKNFELFMVDNQVENILTDAEMQRLLSVLKTDANRNVCLILMLLLSTGARMNEVLSATWKNVSLEGHSLKVDAIRSKSKRSRSIPLNLSAVWVIEQLPSRGKSEYLFPSPVFAKAGKDLPYTNITRAWQRIQKLAKIKIRAHDLRHGFASMLVSSGRTLFEVQQILGHSDPKVTMRYAHLSSAALMAAANTASVIVPVGEPKAA